MLQKFHVNPGFALLWAIVALCLLSLAPPAPAAPDILRTLLQRLATSGRVEIAGAAVYDLPVTQEFYARTGYRPQWVAPEPVEELQAAIEQAWREGMNPEDYHRRQVGGLVDGSLVLDPASRDLVLTDSLVRLTYHYALGKVDPDRFSAAWRFGRDLPRVDPVDWLQAVTAHGGIQAGLDRLKPADPQYRALVAALARYRGIAAAGGWQPLAAGPSLRPGDSGPRVAALRRRLQDEGDAGPGSVGDPEFFDARLAGAVEQFQRRHRLDVDGIVGPHTLDALNVPVSARIGQIRVNLERARVVREIPGTAVVVDIAGFEVSMFHHDRLLLQSRAVVGKPYRRTPVFRGLITYIEFNPTWTVPPTILKRDVLPALQKDPDYLAQRHMQVLTVAGERVDPATVDWQLYPRQHFPYLIRQLPGPDNPLGRLKVMFPNRHLVYLHDTPSQELFRHSERTFSSGCIRVEKIRELAVLLLDDPVHWNEAGIEAAIATGATRRVVLRNPVPIYLVYRTVQVQDDGAVWFTHDPYHRDPLILEALDQPLVPNPDRIPRNDRSQ